jgi:hypothetical protein
MRPGVNAQAVGVSVVQYGIASFPTLVLARENAVIDGKTDSACDCEPALVRVTVRMAPVSEYPFTHGGDTTLPRPTSPLMRTKSACLLTTERSVSRKFAPALSSPPAFGANVDYARLVKLCVESPESAKRYSPAQCIGCEQKTSNRNPDPKHISTSYVEFPI